MINLVAWMVFFTLIWAWGGPESFGRHLSRIRKGFFEGDREDE